MNKETRAENLGLLTSIPNLLTQIEGCAALVRHSKTSLCTSTIGVNGNRNGHSFPTVYQKEAPHALQHVDTTIRGLPRPLGVEISAKLCPFSGSSVPEYPTR